MTITQVSRNDLSFWGDVRDPFPCASLREQIDADIVIVGGGFTGLSAAYHLLRDRPHLKVALIESHSIGAGASGRNTGILRPGIGQSLQQIVGRYGASEAKQLYQASVTAVTAAEQLIRDAKLDCDWQPAPHIKAALTRRQAHALRIEADLLAKLGFDAEFLNARKMAQRAPFSATGGLCFPQSSLVNPLKLCHELKRVVLELGGKIFEQSPVRAIQAAEANRPPSVTTEHGVVRASRVLVAANGYAAQLGIQPGRVIPLQTHLSLTEPLSDHEVATLGWSDRASYADKRHIFNYFRLTKDNRILFGGGRPLYSRSDTDRRSGATDVANDAVFQSHAAEFAARFPDLRKTAFVKQWSGTMGMTVDELPVIGEVPKLPGVYFAGGWSGHGVASATASGAVVADLLTESPLPAIRWIRRTAAWVPADPIRSAALNTYLHLLQWADRCGALSEKLNHWIRVRSAMRSNDQTSVFNLIHPVLPSYFPGGTSMTAQLNGTRFVNGQQRGHYESFYQRANHPTKPQAFWIRYTIFQPDGRPEAAIGELWAVYLNGDTGERVAVKEEYPIDRCRFDREQLGAHIHTSHLIDSRLEGVCSSAGNEIQWQLGYRGDQEPILMFPPAYYQGNFPKAKSLVGLPLAVYQGALQVNGNSIPIHDWVGSQNHNWGSKHTDHYAFGQVAGFDNSPDSFLEIVSAQLKLGKIWTPMLTPLVLRHRGRDHRANSMLKCLTNRGRFANFAWTFSAETSEVRIEGEISAPRNLFVGLNYYNPIGGIKHCLNTKLASCRLTVTNKDDGSQETLTTAHRTAFEILSDPHDHGVRICA